MAKTNWTRVRAEKRMEKYGRETLSGTLYDGVPLPEFKPRTQSLDLPKPKTVQTQPTRKALNTTCPDCKCQLSQKKLAKHLAMKCPQRLGKKSVTPKPKLSLAVRETKKPKPTPTKPRNPEIPQPHKLIGAYKTDATGRVTLIGLPANKEVVITVTYH